MTNIRPSIPLFGAYVDANASPPATTNDYRTCLNVLALGCSSEVSCCTFRISICPRCFSLSKMNKIGKSSYLHLPTRPVCLKNTET